MNGEKGWKTSSHVYVVEVCSLIELVICDGGDIEGIATSSEVE